MMIMVIDFLERRIEFGFEIKRLQNVGATEEDIEKGFWKAFDLTLEKFPLPKRKTTDEDKELVRKYLGDKTKPNYIEIEGNWELHTREFNKE